MRTIETTLLNILSLIHCADQYGYNKQVLMYAFADMIGSLSDEEIEEYAQYVMSRDGYGIEDYDDAKETLIKFRSKWL